MGEPEIANNFQRQEELFPDDRLQSVAQSIVRRGLATPAKILLEMHKPLSGVLYNLSIFSAPLLFVVFGTRIQKNLELFFESSGNIEHLIEKIEELEHSAVNSIREKE